MSFTGEKLVERFHGAWEYISWLALAIFFISLGVLAFSNILSSFFLSDDFDLIRASIINPPLTIWKMGRFVRPLIFLSLWADYAIWGLNPLGYHLTNIIIHSLNSFLIVLILNILLNKFVKPSSGLILPIFSGMIFLLLPCHTEAVSWISGRTDLIATLLVLSSFYTFLIYKYYYKQYYLAFSMLLFAGALLSKESVIAYPAIILLAQVYIYLVDKKSYEKPTNLMVLPLLYLLILLLYLIVRYVVLGEIIGGYGSEIHAVVDLLIFNKSINRSVVKTIIPLNIIELLNINRWIFIVFAPFAWLVIIISILIFTISFIVMAYRKLYGLVRNINPELLLLFFLVSMFLFAFLPSINLHISIDDSGSDRLYYFPSVFLAIFIVIIISSIWGNMRYSLVTLSLLIIMYASCLYIQNNNWRTAGEISKSITKELAEVKASADNIYLINLPDNINGAYIFRNGIVSALYLWNHGNEYAKKIIAISFQGLQTKAEGVKLNLINHDIISVRFSNSTFGNCVLSKRFWINGTLSSDSNLSADIPIGGTLVNQFYEVFDIKPQGYNLRFNCKEFNKNNIAFYSDGKIYFPSF